MADRSPAGFADAARRAVAAGYRAVKLAPFDGVIAADVAQTPIDARTRDGLDRAFAALVDGAFAVPATAGIGAALDRGGVSAHPYQP